MPPHDPQTQLLTIDDVMRLTGYKSRSSIYRLVRQIHLRPTSTPVKSSRNWRRSARAWSMSSGCWTGRCSPPAPPIAMRVARRKPRAKAMKSSPPRSTRPMIGSGGFRRRAGNEPALRPARPCRCLAPPQPQQSARTVQAADRHHAGIYRPGRGCHALCDAGPADHKGSRHLCRRQGETVVCPRIGGRSGNDDHRGRSNLCRSGPRRCRASLLCRSGIRYPHLHDVGWCAWLCRMAGEPVPAAWSDDPAARARLARQGDRGNPCHDREAACQSNRRGGRRSRACRWHRPHSEQAGNPAHGDDRHDWQRQDHRTAPVARRD